MEASPLSTAMTRLCPKNECRVVAGRVPREAWPRDQTPPTPPKEEGNSHSVSLYSARIWPDRGMGVRGYGHSGLGAVLSSCNQSLPIQCFQ